MTVFKMQTLLNTTWYVPRTRLYGNKYVEMILDGQRKGAVTLDDAYDLFSRTYAEYELRADLRMAVSHHESFYGVTSLDESINSFMHRNLNEGRLANTIWKFGLHVKALQVKHIPTVPILQLLDSFNGKWASHWSGMDVCVLPAFPAWCADIEPSTHASKLILAKMRSLKKSGLVDGCPCGCRGDWVITKKGIQFLKEHADE